MFVPKLGILSPVSPRNTMIFVPGPSLAYKLDEFIQIKEKYGADYGGRPRTTEHLEILKRSIA
jgi:hypothetical protein